ncbi:hypothetical protein Prudu_010829 [Prunus dulcis]|uniref:Uncharacterized protein n=1 Tax=Prunus dulcis TaxID=3755 RepID=A0A4Y1R994_PRUDU|nr:hypothetical protein Prudu_010829 [Prunus dulcis]
MERVMSMLVATSGDHCKLQFPLLMNTVIQIFLALDKIFTQAEGQACGLNHALRNLCNLLCIFNLDTALPRMLG